MTPSAEPAEDWGFSLPVKGFLGTGATFDADDNLVVLLLNLLMIGLVMWPSFRRQGNPTFPRVLHRSYYAAPMVHAALGMMAELLGLYIVVVASTNVLPAWLRFRNWKRWMRTEFVLWLIVVISGVGTYYAWY